MNYLYAYILVTIIIITWFYYNNTINCNMYLSHCLDINIYIQWRKWWKKYEQTINCINETSNELITIILFIFIIIISLLNIFFIIKSHNQHQLIYSRINNICIVIINILSLIRCIKPVSVKDVTNYKKEKY